MFVAPLQNALLFTVNTLFNIYISIVLFRFLLQISRADFYNPIAQFAYKATNPVLAPFRKIIPTYRGIDFSALILAMALQVLELILELIIRGFHIPPSLHAFSGVFIWGVGELTDILLVILLFAMIIQVVASWLQPGQYNPATAILAQITAPIVSPLRRVLPTAGMIDFSPMIVIFCILFLRKLVPVYLVAYGQQLL